MAEHFPTPWSVHTLTATIYATEVPKGPARVADMRGWGYLTGKGHGALALPEDEAIEIQRANAAHIVKCVNAFDEMQEVLADLWLNFSTTDDPVLRSIVNHARALLPEPDLADLAGPVGGARE